VPPNTPCNTSCIDSSSGSKSSSALLIYIIYILL
jgi:hypothetical protein